MKLTRSIHVLLAALSLGGCGIVPGLSRSVISTSCSIQSGDASVAVTVSAPDEQSLLSSIRIEMRYPLSAAAELTGLNLPDQMNEASGLLRDALAVQLGMEPEQIKCEWNDQTITLDASSEDVRGLLDGLGSYPSSMKYADVVSSLKSASRFVCD